jgi:hypothetical protein
VLCSNKLKASAYLCCQKPATQRNPPASCQKSRPLACTGPTQQAAQSLQQEEHRVLHEHRALSCPQPCVPVCSPTEPLGRQMLSTTATPLINPAGVVKPWSTGLLLHTTHTWVPTAAIQRPPSPTKAGVVCLLLHPPARRSSGNSTCDARRSRACTVAQLTVGASGGDSSRLRRPGCF